MHLFTNNQFYHEETKRLLTSLGEMFSGIRIEKKNSSGLTEKAYDVPVVFGPKNKWLSLVRERPDLTKQQVQITLPRMSFEVTEMRYAPERRQGMNRNYATASTSTGRTKIYSPVPYDVNISLHAMTKDQNDALQIVEQILPFFQPSMRISFDVLPQFNVIKEIPIVMTGVDTEDNYDESSPDTQRVVINTFNFTAQMVFFGPIEHGKSYIKDAKVGVSATDKTLKDKTVNYEAKVNPTSAKKEGVYTIDEIWR